MRTGIIPNSHASVEDAASSRPAPVIVPESLRAHLRAQAVLLDEIADAARAGSTADVLTLADDLRLSIKYTGVLDFDTTAA